MTELELSTESRLAAGGQAVARAPDGRVVFVEGAAPSERVRAEVIKDNPRFLRARVVEVLEPSPERVTPTCTHYERCGGCELQHVSVQAQLQSKHDAVLTTLQKIGRLSPVRALAPWSGAGYGYRARARFAVSADGRLGYREKRGRRVVGVDECPVLHPALQRLLRGKVPGRRANLELSAVTDGERVAAAWRPDGPRLVVEGVQWPGPAGEDPGLKTDDGWLHPDVFSQANPAGNRALCRQVEDWLARLDPVDRAVELYAGSGNFSVLLARAAASLRTYEAAASAVELARRVVPSAVQSHVATAEDAVAARCGAVDLILVDPPRAGLSLAVVAGIADWAQRAIVYVSCDPATFARDAGRLSESGWQLEEVRLFDLYPQTAHAEVAGWFTRRADTSGRSSD